MMSIHMHLRRLFPFFLSLLFVLSACQFFSPPEKRALSENDKVRTQALKTLSDLSTEKKGQISFTLVKALSDKDTRIANRAADALVALGSPSLPALKSALHDPDVFARLNAVAALGRIGPFAASAAPEVMSCLSDPHPLMKQEAVNALGNMGETIAPLAAPALKPLTHDPDPELRELAAQALKKMGIQP